jgi:hypothetical protein
MLGSLGMRRLEAVGGYVQQHMKYVKVTGLLWGLIYFVMGAVTSFTINSIDFLASLVLLFTLFLLPLPIAFVAVWSPRNADKALLGCLAVNMADVAFLPRPARPIW